MRRTAWPAYFLLTSLFPVLALLARNVGQAAITDGLRAAVASMALALAVFLGGWALTRDIQRAAILSVLAVLLVFSYGHVYQAVEGRGIGGLVLGRHRVLLPAWVALTVLGSVLILRGRFNASRLAPALNLASLALVAMPVASLLVYQIRVAWAAVDAARSGAPLAAVQARSEMPPDVYYIVLDAYGRQDTLRDLFGYDNSELLNSLRAMGFYVADDSRSNYAQTELSLLSSLEFDYLQTLGHDQCGQCPRWARIRNSAIVRTLSGLGYKVIALESGYNGTEWYDADIYLSTSMSSASRLQLVGGTNSFEALLIRTSIGLAILDSLDVLPDSLQTIERGPHDRRRQLLLFQFDQLSRIPQIPGPKFIFAHILAPHSPYVFGPDGAAITPDPASLEEDTSSPEWLAAETRGYPLQLGYVNKRILEAVRHILETSEQPPVIILQGDHGPWMNLIPARMQILNAYYLPGEGDNQLYPSISPVNSFRVVLDRYFDAGLPLLEDISYYSTYYQPYDFEVVPNQ